MASQSTVGLTGIVDTTVLVDLLRKHPPAITWLEGQSRLGISAFTWMEIVFGAQNKIAQRQGLDLLRLFDVVYPSQTDIDWSMAKLLAHRLKDNAGIGDCLIASSSNQLNIPFYTHNLKHFRPLIGEFARRPY